MSATHQDPERSKIMSEYEKIYAEAIRIKELYDRARTPVTQGALARMYDRLVARVGFDPLS
jgi:hypothetical protein